MQKLIRSLLNSSRLVHKQNIRHLWHLFPQVCEVEGHDVIVGDDAAAIKTRDGYLLLAAEGVYLPLLNSNPYLAGCTSVITNVNDIYAMGGKPVAIVDVLYSSDFVVTNEVLRGIRDNSNRYMVPLVGGHLTQDADCSALSLFILGKSKKIISGFNAQVDDDLVFVSSLSGKYYRGFNFWDSSSHLSGEEARRQLDMLFQIAEDELVDAGKDISMSGLVGSILMLLEGSGKGAEIYMDKIPAPLEVSLEDWLLTFPSYGFILSLRSFNTDMVKERFQCMGLVCERIGKVITGSKVLFRNEIGEKELFWDFDLQSLIGLKRESSEKAVDG